MKRILALLIALTLLAAMALPAAAEAAPLFSWDGFTVELLNYKIDKFPRSTATMYLYARVVNDTDRKLSLWFEDATMNGVPIMVVGLLGIEPHTDSGADSEQAFYAFASSDNREDGSDAIAAGGQLHGSLLLKDSDSGEDLVLQEVTIDLDSVGGTRSIRTPLPTLEPTPTPKPTPKPTPEPEIEADFGHGGYDDDANYAPAYTPKSRDYKTLKKGSKGQAVRDLQQRLVDLGYLCDKVDGVYGRNTNTAVRSFQEQNNLPISSEASPEMQEKLYSSYAKYHVMPYLPLMIAGSFFLKNPIETGTSAGSMRIELVNRSSTQAIRGYELSFYQTDMYGNRIDYHPDGAGVYVFDHEILDYVEPGHYVNTDDSWLYPIRNYWSTYAVYVGVKKVVMDDGEVRELDYDDITYFECRVAE